MRRDIGMVLAGLGTFLIVLAVAMPTYLASQLIKFPLNYYYKAVLNGPNATYFSASQGKEITGANVQAIYTLDGNGKAGNSSTAVWDLFSVVYDTAIPGPNGQIQIQTRQFAFDRKNATLVNCCGHNLNGKAVPESGVVGDVFPMGTQPHSYNVFDTTLLKPVPFQYTGTDTVDGVHSYKFTETVAPTKVGFTPLSATDPEMYAINLTYWVDPDTGALLKVKEHQQQFLQNPITGARTTTLFDTTLQPTAQSVQAIVNIDKSGRLKKTLIETVLPIAVGVLGAILLAAGFLMARRRRDLTESAADPLNPQLAAATADPGPAPISSASSSTASSSTIPNGATPGGAAPGGASAQPRTSPRHAAPAGMVPGMDPDPTVPIQDPSDPDTPRNPPPS